MGRTITRPELKGGFTVAGVEIVDANGDIKAPVATTNLTATGNTTIGDAITDTLNVKSVSTFGTSGVPLVLTAGTPLVSVYSTNAGTSGSISAEPFYMKSILTGAGQVGGRARFHTYSNVASGGWVNALKGYMEFGASGRTTGLASAVVGETVLSAGTVSGAYCALEGEIVLGSEAVTGGQTSFIYLNATGANVANFDTYGYLMSIGTGVTAATGKFLSANTQTAKYLIGTSTTRYSVLSQTEDGVGLGASASPMSVTYNGTKPLSVYTTCASTNASTSYEPVLINTVMTGAGQVGGRVRINMETNVALGGWANALKVSVDCKTNGRATGLLSVSCHEIIMPASAGGAGTYAVIEGEIVCPASWTGTNPVSYFYLASSGDTVTNFDTYGYLFTLVGCASGSANFWYDNTAGAPGNVDEWVRVKTPGGDRKIALYNF